MKTASTLDVLLVEDEPADIYLIERAIADWSPYIWVWQVSNGSQALAFLRHEPPFVKSPSPALILLDLNIPGHNGHAVLAELRALAPYHTTPVIVISGSTRAVEEVRCLELGANAYVQKSLDFDTYFASIQAMLRNWLRADYTAPPPEWSHEGEGAHTHGGIAMPQEERIIQEIHEIFSRAQEQVRLAQHLREVHSETAKQVLYRQLHENLALLAHICEQAQALVSSCLAKEST